MQKYEAVCKLFSIGQGQGHGHGQGNELCKMSILKPLTETDKEKELKFYYYMLKGTTIEKEFEVAVVKKGFNPMNWKMRAVGLSDIYGII